MTYAYTISMQGVGFNNHLIAGSDEFNVGVVDSGTTFTYVSHKLYNMLVTHFDWFCSIESENHCKGKRRTDGKGQDNICFWYNENESQNGPKNYFLTYPVLNFKTKDQSGLIIDLKWYPSEYLFRLDFNTYCVALEKFNRPNEILFGGSFMR